MNAPDFRGRILFIAAVVCVALNFVVILRPGGFGRSVVRALRDPDQVMHVLAPVDRLFVDLGNDQNSILVFNNFGEDSRNLAELLYYRSCYAAYPRKVFAAPDGTVINRGSDLLANAFHPDEHWLNEHHVTRMFAYEEQPNGSIKAMVGDRKLP